MKKNMLPDYKLIFTDIILKKHPAKELSCRTILKKDVISVLDVIKLNDLVFGTGDKTTSINNQKYRAYDESTIIDILKYQKRNKLNNSQLATHFKISRNTIAKWKKFSEHDSVART
ncbi:helix-turn-helix domain-containing protein [Chryseobacterium antibioticum]|uniref:Helix-turn-helix domain-containing protein n=1 Tax=Chryseobacterium pyrolae TaxID=2987481 RepID=A0ABT2IKK3_9FLAO|nr:helix-turn-helix domain-containing protein [Chryseobacterium pyrolae]MCT2409141.1 helix-turn-helix domain-containing protein [Chryseobacterium pyrolae]